VTQVAARAHAKKGMHDRSEYEMQWAAVKRGGKVGPNGVAILSGTDIECDECLLPQAAMKVENIPWPPGVSMQQPPKLEATGQSTYTVSLRVCARDAISCAGATGILLCRKHRRCRSSKGRSRKSHGGFPAAQLPRQRRLKVGWRWWGGTKLNLSLPATPPVL
jgi:hypothetical protein